MLSLTIRCKPLFDREDQVFELTLETSTGQKLVEPGRQFVANFYKELKEAAEAYVSQEGHI